jgi:hypothetical protein
MDLQSVFAKWNAIQHKFVGDDEKEITVDDYTKTTLISSWSSQGSLLMASCQQQDNIWFSQGKFFPS